MWGKLSLPPYFKWTGFIRRGNLHLEPKLQFRSEQKLLGGVCKGRGLFCLGIPLGACGWRRERNCFSGHSLRHLVPHEQETVSRRWGEILCLLKVSACKCFNWFPVIPAYIKVAERAGDKLWVTSTHFLGFSTASFTPQGWALSLRCRESTLRF